MDLVQMLLLLAALIGLFAALSWLVDVSPRRQHGADVIQGPWLAPVLPMHTDERGPNAPLPATDR